MSDIRQITPVQLARAIDEKGDVLLALVRELTPVIQARVSVAMLRYAGRAAGRNMRQETDDLIQEVFVSLFADNARTLRAWDPDLGLTLDRYVSMIAYRKAMATLRIRGRSPWTEHSTDPNTLDDGAKQRGTVEAGQPEQRVANAQLLVHVVDRLRERLSPLGCEVFELLYIEELSVDEVCERMKMKRDTVYAWRSRLTRAAREVYDVIQAEQGRPQAAAVDG